MPQFFKFVLTLLVLGVFAAGCGDSGTPEAPSDASQEASATPAQEAQAGPPVTGGRYLDATIGEPINLISILATDTSSRSITTHIFTRLLEYDENLEIAKVAAESYEVLEGGKLLKFKLHENIRWTDGTPLTAEDVEFTYQVLTDPKVPSAYQENYKLVQSFTVTGPYTFEVRYDKPLARGLNSWMTDILPKHLLKDENLLETEFSRNPVGAGAYTLTQWDAGSRLILDANPDYFEGRANIDRIITRVIPDQSTQFLELKAGNLDSMALTPKQYLRQTDTPYFKENFNKFKYLASGYTYLGYNLKRPLFQDVRVRRALTHAIDKNELVQGVLQGLGRPGISPYKPGTWVYNEALKPYGYDPEKAKALLAEAGWTDSDGDGVLDKDGQPFEFTILTNQGNDLRIKTGTILQQRLAQVGVAVKVRIVEWAAFIKEFVHKGDFDAIILGWNIIPDPDIYNVWHSSKHPPGLNHTYYANAELDELLEQGRHILDQAERKVIYDRVQDILHEDQPYTFLYYAEALPIVHSRIQGIEPAPSGIGHNFYHWWVPQDQQRFTLQK